MADHFQLLNGSFLDVGVIYCIGRNYSEHAKEMGAKVEKEPVVFIKPPTAYATSGSKISIPPFSNLMHHEVELVVVIGKDCNNVNSNDAMDCIAGYGVGVDFTLRDIQSEAKKQGLPWATAKSFFGSAPVSPIVPIENIDNPDNCKIELKVNGDIIQSDTTSKMQRSVAELISYISHVFRLRKGDSIFTGTPKGVGPVRRGDLVTATLNDSVHLDLEIE